MCFPEFRQFSDFLQQDFPVVKKRKFSENHIFSVELMHEWHCVPLTKSFALVRVAFLEFMEGNMCFAEFRKFSVFFTTGIFAKGGVFYNRIFCKIFRDSSIA